MHEIVYRISSANLFTILFSVASAGLAFYTGFAYLSKVIANYNGGIVMSLLGTTI